MVYIGIIILIIVILSISTYFYPKFYERRDIKALIKEIEKERQEGLPEPRVSYTDFHTYNISRKNLMSGYEEYKRNRNNE